ncbi:thermonuclease family protein, partial [Alphaproteobacteria bacterium]|nr:thermonuclease family protein [Alphaproteobacteria bacterium]
SVCYVNGEDINALLVERGWALAYRKYSKDYVHQENQARINNLGLWSGKFTLPWEWRSKNR